MGSLTTVVLPSGKLSAPAFRVHQHPTLLVWAEGDEGQAAEALSILRGHLAGRLAAQPYDIPSRDEPLAPGQQAWVLEGWEVFRYARFTILGSRIIVAEIGHSSGSTELTPWWQDVLIPELRLKFGAVDIETN